MDRSLHQDDSEREENGLSEIPPDESEMAAELAECQLSLYAFIAALVGNHADIEDIRQNTNLALWRKLHEAVEIRSVHALARGIAYVEVLRHRRGKGRASSVLLDDEALRQVAEVAQQEAELLDRRRAALHDCVQKLTETDNRLLHLHYRQGITLKDAAEVIGRSASSVRHSMSRIRRQLKKCVDLAIVAGESP